jgi:hypothetical protein
MPAFPSPRRGLIHGLSLEHGYPAASAPEPAPPRAWPDFGRKLSGPTAASTASRATGSAPRARRRSFERRARTSSSPRRGSGKDYYDRWVREPLRLEPGHQDAQFIKDGRTQLTEILDGDGVKQAGRPVELPASKATDPAPG